MPHRVHNFTNILYDYAIILLLLVLVLVLVLLLLLLIGRWPVYSSASLHLFIGQPWFLFPSGIPS